MARLINIRIPGAGKESNRHSPPRHTGGGVELFRLTMDFALSLARTDPLALSGFAYLIGRRLQAAVMTKVFGYPPDSDSAVFRCDSDHLIFRGSEPLTRDGRSFDDLIVPIARNSVRVDLSRDIILPWPWELERVSGALSGLRKGGQWGKWRQDRFNHIVIWWSPLSIAWVDGGNHSILAGIAHGTGRIVPNQAYDISPVYRHVRCDGVAYRRSHDNSVIAKVRNVDFAILFETGRLSSRTRTRRRRRPERVVETAPRKPMSGTCSPPF
jgi:hypothetical protein